MNIEKVTISPLANTIRINEKPLKFLMIGPYDDRKFLCII